MTEQTYPHKPIRNHDGDVVFPNAHQRPHAAYRLDGLHKTLWVLSIALAVVVPIFFVLQTFGASDLLPVRYGIDGEVLREGSVWEAAGGLTLLGLATIAVAVLARYPRIFHYPITLTERNAQHQYKNAARLMIWMALSMALIMLVMTASWLGVIAMGWIWLPLGLLVVAAIVFLGRMLTLR